MPIRRGEIYFVNLNPISGREQGGERPCIGFIKQCDQQSSFGRNGDCRNKG